MTLSREERKEKIHEIIKPRFEGIRFDELRRMGFAHVPNVELMAILKELEGEGKVRFSRTYRGWGLPIMDIFPIKQDD